MKNLKIGVYSICKNEEQFAEKWAKSGKDADFQFVLDTGSTDQTVSILREHDVRVETALVKPWRFDRARDTSMNLLPDVLDVIICLDLDEVLIERLA